MSCYVKSLRELNYDKEEDLVKKYIDKTLFSKLQAGYLKLAEKNRDQAETFDTNFRLYIATLCDIKENLKPSTMNFVDFVKTLHDSTMATNLMSRISSLSSQMETVHLEMLKSVLKANEHMSTLFSTIGMSQSYYKTVQDMLHDRKKAIIDSLTSSYQRVKDQHDALMSKEGQQASSALKAKLNALRRGGARRKTHRRSSKKRKTMRKA
jgi:hypothetical protein